MVHPSTRDRIPIRPDVRDPIPRSDPWRRLVLTILTIYLSPVLLIVLLLGALAIGALAFGRGLRRLVRRLGSFGGPHLHRAPPPPPPHCLIVNSTAGRGMGPRDTGRAG